jgi:streptogramin lyase
MKTVRFLMVVMLACGAAAWLQESYARSKQQAPAALTGQVTSVEEGPMEGVLVTAKKDGATIALTVVTDAQGRYRFPSSKLDAGHYAIRIRAVGYDLDGPSVADIGPKTPATLDLKLRKTSNLGAQLTNAEWLESIPATPEQKSSLRTCTTCHTLLRPIGSTHDADEFVGVQQRMATYVNQSSPLMPQVRLAPRLAVQMGAKGSEQLDRDVDSMKKQGEFLASINLSKGQEWPYALKTFPRPRGKATHAVITEYDLPAKTRQPHDVAVDSEGMIWYISFGEQILGKLDPKTGKTTEFPIPVLKPGSPRGELALRPDEDGNLWMGMMYQGGVAKFDRKTEKFQTWSIPEEFNKDYTQINQVSPNHAKVDGKVWLQDAGTYAIFRLDPVTGKFERFKPFPDPSPNVYDISPDEQNNLYFTVFGSDKVGRIDARSREISIYQTPTPNSNPRRGALDSQGRFWFGEWGSSKIGMFDTKTSTFKEWTPPTPWSFPYVVIGDKNGEVWGGSTMTDRVMRLDSRTGQFTEYLMPRDTNIRGVALDNTTTPVTFWVGNDHGASIIKLETLE